MHVMQMIDNREWSEMHATAGKEREASSGYLVKTHAWPSLQVAPTDVREWSRYRDGSEWSLINIADVPFLFAVIVRRRPFFQEDPSIMFLTLGLYIMPPDKVEVEPCFVVAALISRAQAQGFGMEKAP